jgi:ribosome-binding protein aMBF1 (putative translation factor)
MGVRTGPPCLVLIVRGHILISVYTLSSVPRDPDILVRFGLRVRELRKSAGLSQEQFAQRCRLDRSYVGGVERGERNVSLRNIAVVARALGISVSELTKGL